MTDGGADATRASMRHPVGDRMKGALMMKRGLVVLAVLLVGIAALSVGASVRAADTEASATLLANGEVLGAGGAAKYETPGDDAATKIGYSALAVNSGDTPYGTAVFSFKQNGVTIAEAGVPPSPPTNSARIFIDYRTNVNAVPARSGAGTIDVNTGIAVVNPGSATANVTYTLRNVAGATITTGHGTIAAGNHFACFIDELKDKVAPDFNLPPDFQNTVQFGSLEMTSDLPISVLALRGTTNQRHDFLFTTTPVADLTKPLSNSPVYFPQFVDGGGYTTSLILLNTSGVTETGRLQIMDNHGAPFVVNPVGGTPDSSFRYSIQPNGVFRFQTDGFPAEVQAGWARLTPDAGTSTPVCSGVFGSNPESVLVSESGIAAGGSTTHARVFVDLSGNHNTGLAIANLADTKSSVTINAFQSDGVTGIGSSQGPLPLDANGHAAAFANEFISGLPADFIGVLDIRSSTPFAALAVRSLYNERHDFLMTTFPIADASKAAPAPIIFPQVVDGGGYVTEFILISAGGAARTILSFYDENGAPDFVACRIEDTYDEGATTCYVDSVNGNDANDGLSEASPVKSQSAINSKCTVVRFKRGSVFNEKLAIPTPFNNVRFGYNVKVYTNYGPKSDPLPQFKVSSEPGRGPVALSFSPLTIDGLHFSGARGDGTMVHDFDFDRDGITQGIVGGIGAFLGAATTFINNEIDDCDIGLMLGGEGSVVRGNYVHDLNMGIDAPPGVDPNLVGGAEGIFINASNSEVSYNAFINCTGPAKWVGSNGDCDGGATEVSAASGGTIKNVNVHHNFSYNSCGFFEVATYFGDQGKGLFKDSSFHNNVIVDSAWMGLLQVNNTDFENVHFYNNTLIQHKGSLNAGYLWIIFTATSSGMAGGQLVPGTVHLTNNLYVLDGVANWYRLFYPTLDMDPAFDTQNNIVASYSGPQDPKYVDLGFANIAGTAASDFNLVKAGSPAVDAGADIAGNTLDFFNRARPNGSAPDIGALEFGSYQTKCIPRFSVSRMR
jgi:hypothetical protein